MNGHALPWEDSDNIVPLRETAPAWMDEEEAARWQAAATTPAEPESEDDGPLPGVADPSEWKDREAPHRRFIIPGWLVRGHAGLLSGMEGVGKSLIAQQMLTCAAIGRPFLGLEIEQVNAVYITCEDTIEELWRRQEAINRSLGITMDDIAGKLLLVSLCGELGNELGTFSKDALLTPSKRFRQIEKLCLDFGAGLVCLDNAAHLFSGNENARHDVAAFLGLLERLSQAIDGAALLLAHPNKQHAQGNKQGNEYSGSTGWSAHVRNRLFLDYVTEDESGEPVDDDARVLRKSKANYGKRGEEITFRWHDWAFVVAADLPGNAGAELEAIARSNVENDAFLRCLKERTKQRRAVSERMSKSYAPAVFADMPEGKGINKKRFEGAMDRLFRMGQIERGKLWNGPDRKPVFGLREAAGNVRETDTGDPTKPLKSLAGNGAGEDAGDVREMCGNSADNVREMCGKSPLPLKGETLGGSPFLGGDDADFGPGDPPEWMDAPIDESEAWRSNSLLNPDFGKDA